MTTYLNDIFSLTDLTDMIDMGFVRKQIHPEAPYTILNYTEKAAFDNVWNPVTLACRGLIYNHNTSEIIARPFKKFMNYGQKGAAVINATDLVAVSDKADGSLGIFYRLQNGDPAIATRGSFTSDQAMHATELWYRKYANVRVPEGLTPLFEIVYRQNRIVLDYGDMDDLVLLGAVQIRDGLTYPVGGAVSVLDWKGPATQVFPYRTLAEALEAPPRPNAEGFVVHSMITDERIKIKQADYVALHKIVTGLSERAVWESLMAGKTRAEIIAPLPDEFHQWTGDVLDRLVDKMVEEKIDIHDSYHMIRHNLDVKFGGGVWGRKEFAMAVVQRHDKWAMFMMLDRRYNELEYELLKRAKPAAFLTPAGVVHNEDTA